MDILRLIGERIACFFRMDATDAHARLNALAGVYGLESSDEIARLRTEFDNLADRGEYEQIDSYIRSIDPSFRVWCLPGTEVIGYSEAPEYHASVLPVATVFRHHLPFIEEMLTKIVVDRTQVRLYAGDQKIAVYFAQSTIPHDLAVGNDPIHSARLVADLTGMSWTRDQLRRMNHAVIERYGGGWLVEFLKGP